jgi:hypothetical protein
MLFRLLYPRLNSVNNFFCLLINFLLSNNFIFVFLLFHDFDLMLNFILVNNYFELVSNILDFLFSYKFTELSWVCKFELLSFGVEPRLETKVLDE